MNPIFSVARQAERNLIAYLLAGGTHPPDGLLPSMLGDADHAAILAAMNRLRDDGESMSIGAVAARLIAVRGEKTSSGQEWGSYLEDTARNEPYVTDVAEWVRLIVKADLLRMRIEKTEELVGLLRDGSHEAANQELESLVNLMTVDQVRTEVGVAADELVKRFPNLREPLIDGILRRGETCNIIAASKVGKSWLSLSLALSVANGLKWLGRFWTKRGRVLIVDNELHLETITDRLRKVSDAIRVDLNNQVLVESFRGRLTDLHSLATKLSRLKPGSFDLIVLDAWYRFLPKGSDENSNSDVTALYNLLDSVAGKIDAAFVCIHHSSKGDQSGKSVTDVGSGAGAQSRAADTHLVIRPHEEPHAAVVDAATRSFKPIEPFVMRWQFPVWQVDDELDPTKLKPLKPSRDDQKAEREEKRLVEDRANALKAYRQFPEGETKNVLKEAAGLSGTRFGPTNLALIEEGAVIPCEVKKGKCSYPGYRLNPAWSDNSDKLGQLGLSEAVLGTSDNPSLEGCPTYPPTVDQANELFPTSGGRPA